MFLRSTNKPWVTIAIVIALMLGLAPLFLTRTTGSSGNLIVPGSVTKNFPPPPSAADLQGKQAVKIGVYILSVGNLDTSTSRYSVDFFLNFVCQTQGCNPTDFDLINAGSGADIQNQTSPTDQAQGKYYYRIRATMRTNLDLHNFPFDKHTLEIEIEDKNQTDNQFVYIADPKQSNIDQSVYVSGWDLVPKITGEVNSHYYDVYEESYSRARFYITIDHPWFSSFMKGLFAAIVIVAVGMLSFLMAPADAKDRIGLTSATLASAIFYHLTLTASIPPVGYLTYADRFMILQYVFITVSLGVSVILFLLLPGEGTKTGNHDLAEQIHRTTRWIIPLLWIASMVVLQWVTIGF